MGKFIIENILIEKSDKDITTGIKHSLSAGFNLICGNNEAGKSSLMNFIKGSFFKTKGIDTGKIYFKICDKSYRADIKDARATNDRCKIYDEQNNVCDYKLIEDNIKQKYFEEGFTINLDDLMKIQNKETEEFINVIKDPSGDKLNSFLEKINDKIALNLSLDGKLKKNAKEITDKISNFNSKIKELSTKEYEYNNCILEIKNLQQSIKELIEKEEHVKIVEELNILNSNKKELEEEKKEALFSFNEKLFANKEHYIDIIQSVGKFSSNAELIEKNKQKLEVIKSKILENKTRLNIECGISLSEEILKTLDLDYEKIRKIKDLVEESIQVSANKKFEEQKIEDLENILLKLKCEIETINTKEQINNVEELETLTQKIEEDLRQYHFLVSEIDNVNKNRIINSGSIENNKKIQILLGLLFLVTVACAIVSFYQKIQTAGIFSILMSILALAGYSSLKLSNYDEMHDSEKERKIEQKNNILEDLKLKIKPYFPEIENIETSYLPIKLDTLKQQFQSQISEFKVFNESLLKIATERNFTEEKLLATKSKISNYDEKLANLKEEIIKLSNKNIVSEEIFGKKYLEAIEIIKSIKAGIEEENEIQNEVNQYLTSNNEIFTAIKNFIIENNIDITISENINETITEIKRYYDKNNIIKQHIDALNSQIETLEKKINSIGQIQNIEIEFSKEELIQEKEEKQKQKKEAEFRKRDLEKVEGISELKAERNLQIEKYRTLIKNLYVNKMVLELTSIAKSEFDKTQPDLINAQKYLAILTDNKYSKINLELQEIENEDGTKIKKWEHLSRGTKEQLYLALRLGYASNYSKDKTTLEPNGKADLPLVVDDAFVNFDAKRTKNALKCLLEFSKTNQVLFFTCHTEMITKMMKELEGESINIIQL